ncbi:MAG TPA: transposase [Candidatus Dormibacteraeota bacterium]|nr:transposase [Candidatus Dormibacteraeota bacterium]
MARALRLERPGGRYHVATRGNERKPIYRDDSDRTHFLKLLAETTERFGLRIHAYVLMDNHFHLLLETPEANLSRAMQWLNVSYSVWFNRRHNRAGHLFQGRFKAVVVQEDADWQEVARYIHLNPVRLGTLGLGKRQRAAARAGTIARPPADLIVERLARLRDFRWSSYRAYAGYGAAVGWLWRQPLDRLCGGRSEAERRAALRQYTEAPVRQGVLERPWDRLVAGLVLGSEAFARRLLQQVRANAREQPAWRKLQPKLAWTAIVSALEKAKGESWAEFSGRHGDWGRDAALWLGRKRGRYTLGELGQLAGGMDYAAVGQAVSRFGKHLERQSELRRNIAKVEKQISNIEM